MEELQRKLRKYATQSVSNIMDQTERESGSSDEHVDNYDEESNGCCSSFRTTLSVAEEEIFIMLKQEQNILENSKSKSETDLTIDECKEARAVAEKVSERCIGYINGEYRHGPDNIISRSIESCKCNTVVLVFIIIATFFNFDYSVASLFKTSGLNIWVNPLIILCFGIFAFLLAYFVIFTSDPEKMAENAKNTDNILKHGESKTCISSVVQLLLIVGIIVSLFEAIYYKPNMDDLLDVFKNAYVAADIEIVEEIQNDFQCCGISDPDDTKIYSKHRKELKCPNQDKIKKVEFKGCEKVIEEKFDKMEASLMRNFLKTIFVLTILLGLSSSYLVRWGDQFPYNVLKATAQYLHVSSQSEHMSKYELRRYLEQIFASTVLQSAPKLDEEGQEMLIKVVKASQKY